MKSRRSHTKKIFKRGGLGAAGVLAAHRTMTNRTRPSPSYTDMPTKNIYEDDENTPIINPSPIVEDNSGFSKSQVNPVAYQSVNNQITENEYATQANENKIKAKQEYLNNMSSKWQRSCSGRFSRWNPYCLNLTRKINNANRDLGLAKGDYYDDGKNSSTWSWFKRKFSQQKKPYNYGGKITRRRNRKSRNRKSRK